jgi:hypothetical protein
MKNYLTIYLQYINGNPKISINIKVSYHSLKNLTNRSTKKLIDERKNVWGCVSSRKSDRERKNNKKINSKPCMLPRACSCSRPAQHVSNQFTVDRPAGQVEIRLEPYFLGHELDRSFFLFQYLFFKRRRYNQFLMQFAMWGVSKKDRNLTITVGGP